MTSPSDTPDQPKQGDSVTNEVPPTHVGRCVESIDGDGEPMGCCVVCYQPMTDPTPERVRYEPCPV